MPADSLTGYFAVYFRLFVLQLLPIWHVFVRNILFVSLARHHKFTVILNLIIQIDILDFHQIKIISREIMYRNGALLYQDIAHYVACCSTVLTRALCTILFYASISKNLKGCILLETKTSRIFFVCNYITSVESCDNKAFCLNCRFTFFLVFTALN